MGTPLLPQCRYKATIKRLKWDQGFRTTTWLSQTAEVTLSTQTATQLTSRSPPAPRTTSHPLRLSVAARVSKAYSLDHLNWSRGWRLSTRFTLAISRTSLVSKTFTRKAMKTRCYSRLEAQLMSRWGTLHFLSSHSTWRRLIGSDHLTRYMLNIEEIDFVAI